MASANLQTQTGQWASSAAVHEWINEYGDVGPRHEDLEKQLFGGDFHMRSDIKFDKYVFCLLFYGTSDALF